MASHLGVGRNQSERGLMAVRGSKVSHSQITESNRECDSWFTLPAGGTASFALAAGKAPTVFVIRFELAPVLQIIHHTRKFLGVHIHNILSHVKPTKHEASEKLRVGFALFSCRARVSNAEYKPEPAVGTKKKKLKKRNVAASGLSAQPLLLDRTENPARPCG